MSTYQEILDRLLPNPIKLVVAGGIVNPAGPTFGALFLERARNKGDWTLCRLSLNPFEQTLNSLRPATLDDSRLTSHTIEHDGLAFAAAPTFLIFGTSDATEVSRSIRNIALASRGFATTVDLLRCFPGNPWDRISFEMKRSEPLLRGNIKPEPRGITEQDIADYMLLISDHENFKQEVAAFYAAWDGSIDWQRSHGNLQLANDAMPATDMREAMDKFVHAVLFPDQDSAR